MSLKIISYFWAFLQENFSSGNELRVPWYFKAMIIKSLISYFIHHAYLFNFSVFCKYNSQTIITKNSSRSHPSDFPNLLLLKFSWIIYYELNKLVTDGFCRFDWFWKENPLEHRKSNENVWILYRHDFDIGKVVIFISRDVNVRVCNCYFSVVALFESSFALGSCSVHLKRVDWRRRGTGWELELAHGHD